MSFRVYVELFRGGEGVFLGVYGGLQAKNFLYLNPCRTWERSDVLHCSL